MNARVRAAILSIVCVAWGRIAFADGAASPPLVRVAAAPVAAEVDPIVVEALNRLPFELADVGFAVPDPGQPADFVVGIARVGEEIVVSVTAIDRGPGNILLRRVALTDFAGADTDRGATIAIRAVEILRATILQVTAAAAPALRPPPAGIRAAPAASESPGWAVGVGTSALQSFRGFATALGLSAYVAVRPRAWLSLEVAAAAPILQADLRAPDGTATLHQETLGVGLRYIFRASQRVRPSASLSGGAYHVSVDGHARVGDAVSSRLTAPFAAAGIGVMLARRESLALQLQAQALFVQRAPFVVVDGVDAGHAGRPLMLVTLEIEWRQGFRSRTIR